MDIEGRVVLQGLLQSLGQTEYNAQRPTQEMVERMAERLSAILGDSPDVSHGGERLNEQGEPIREISEPVQDNEDPENIPADLPLIPLSSLPPDERARKRTEMERLLDELEEEEQAEAERAEARERERGQELVEKRKRETEDRIQEAKKLKSQEKKMGKALLRGLSDDPPKPSSSSSSKPEAKKVSFAPETIRTDEQKKEGGWGDITLAKPSLSSLSAIAPMKLNVVERAPGTSRAATVMPEPDSDDETPPPSEEGQSDDDEDEHSRNSDSEPDSDGDEWDFDTASHHREVALEYHRMRQTIGTQAMEEAYRQAQQEGEHEWDRENVPLDATLAGSPPRSNVSRFRSSLYSSRAAASAPTSQGPRAVVLDSSALRGAVRLGKLENDELVGGEEGESGSEDEQIAKAKAALLRDDSEHIDNPVRERPAEGMDIASGSIIERQKTEVPDNTPKHHLPSSATPIAKPSRFRALREQALPVPRSDSNTRSMSSTPVDPAARSSPKIISDNISESTIIGRSGVAEPSRISSKPAEKQVMRDEVRATAGPTTQIFTESTPSSQPSAPRKISRFKASRTG
ncbi:hypothetical protein SISNIDRAFT_470199 [Sistotremastrum niveocremeum HHB9708]|uniref:DUF3835 domain-containing protein n=1 Tax=Sistotremastrum niveocremeum HHB9708 TaxID=1314777 RepID=A0A164P5U3_9AGAM|nr:hypothetical protein SISNIDRAFT_470199 [Sistotremastrum niveocremeum HHB9708]